MTIAEMEPLIDKIGLKKLEVKMKKGRQVHWFVCGRNLREPNEKDKEEWCLFDGAKIGDIVVFDGEGRCYITPDYQIVPGDTYDIRGIESGNIIMVGFRGGFRNPQFDLSKVSLSKDLIR